MWKWPRYTWANWKSAAICRPANQRPLSARCAATAASALPNILQPGRARWGGARQQGGAAKAVRCQPKHMHKGTVVSLQGLNPAGSRHTKDNSAQAKTCTAAQESAQRSHIPLSCDKPLPTILTGNMATSHSTVPNPCATRGVGIALGGGITSACTPTHPHPTPRWLLPPPTHR